MTHRRSGHRHATAPRPTPQWPSAPRKTGCQRARAKRTAPVPHPTTQEGGPPRGCTDHVRGAGADNADSIPVQLSPTNAPGGGRPRGRTDHALGAGARGEHGQDARAAADIQHDRATQQLRVALQRAPVGLRAHLRGGRTIRYRQVLPQGSVHPGVSKRSAQAAVQPGATARPRMGSLSKACPMLQRQPDWAAGQPTAPRGARLVGQHGPVDVDVAVRVEVGRVRGLRRRRAARAAARPGRRSSVPRPVTTARALAPRASSGPMRRGRAAMRRIWRLWYAGRRRRRCAAAGRVPCCGIC